MGARSSTYPEHADGQGPTAAGAEWGWKEAFRLLFDRTDRAIVLLDGMRRIVEANRPAEVMLGRRRDELRGRSIVESITPPDRGRSADEWQSFLRTGEYTGTRMLVRPDGRELPVEFAAVKTIADGRPLAIYVLVDAAHGVRGAREEGCYERLSARERDVVRLIALGNETPQIAEKLYVSQATIRTHVRNAMSKLGARTRAQLVALVVRECDLLEQGAG